MINKTSLIYIVLFIIGLACWHFISEYSDTIRLLISSPLNVLNYICEKYPEIFQAFSITFFESFIGLFIATVFSFIVMVLCLYFPRFLEFILPAMVTSQIIPLITLAPLFITLFGVGIKSKIAMSTLMCFFPIFINFATGVNIISKDLIDLLKVYNASNTFKIFKVYFPLSLPQIFSGLKISATLAVIGSIVAEFNGADVGIGKNLFLSAKRLEPEMMMSSLLFASILGGLMFLTVHLIELKIGRWYLNK